MSIEYLGVWCPTCQQDCLPMRDGTCGFCDTPVDSSSSKTRQEAAAMTGTGETAICKIGDCVNAAAGKGGPWKGMCQEHISAEMSRRHAKRRGSAPKREKRTNGNKVTPGAPVLLSLATRAGRLHELAERLDVLRVETQSVREAYDEALSELVEASSS